MGPGASFWMEHITVQQFNAHWPPRPLGFPYRTYQMVRIKDMLYVSVCHQTTSNVFVFYSQIRRSIHFICTMWSLCRKMLFDFRLITMFEMYLIWNKQQIYKYISTLLLQKNQLLFLMFLGKHGFSKTLSMWALTIIGFFFSYFFFFSLRLL